VIKTDNLPELPKGWTWVEVSDIGTVITGNTPKKSKIEYYGQDYNFYKPTDLNYGYHVNESKDKLSDIGIKKARLLPKRSILVTCIGATIGKTGFNRIEGATNQQINAIVPYEGILPEFIYFICISPQFQKQIIEKSSSTTLPILNKSRFESLLLPISPYNEQKRFVEKIEELFKKLDASVDELKSIKKKLDIYRKSVLKCAFALKEPDKKISEYCDIISGSTPRTSVQEYWGGDILWITPKDLSGYRKKFIDKTNRTITKKGYDSCSTIIIPENNVLMSSRAPIGYLVINKKPMCTNQGFKSYKIKNHEELNEEYLYYQLKHIVEQIKKSGSGTTFSEISKSKATNIMIKVPELKIQKQIVQEIEFNFLVIDKIEGNFNHVLIKQGQLKMSILKNAFQGKLVPQDPSDEPAEVFLNRIKNENQKYEQIRLR
jgi:type I restriction enzyme S subunit